MQETQETCVQSLGGEDSLKEEMVTHYTILAWRIPWTEETSRLQSLELTRVRQGWVNIHTQRINTYINCFPFDTIKYQDYRYIEEIY